VGSEGRLPAVPGEKKITPFARNPKNEIRNPKKNTMRLLTLLSLLLFFTFLLGGVAPARADSLDDELVLRGVGLKTDGASLLDFFRKRIGPPPATEQLAVLSRQLGDKSPAVREKACGELTALGSVAIPVLREVSRDPDDREAAANARRCLQGVSGATGVRVTLAATRLLVLRRPAGSAEVLLGYLPQAEDESVIEEVKVALGAVAFREGKPDPAVLKALDDSLPLRRSTAIDVICTPGAPAPEALHKLLQDPKPSVRLRAALALAGARDAKAVSMLIVLLGELPQSQAQQALDWLYNLAGEQAPSVSLGDDELSRRNVRDAWATWWLASEGPGLLEEFRKRTLNDADREKCAALILKLNDDDFEVRESASNELKKYKSVAVPLLRAAAQNSTELEVRNRATQCLIDIEKDKDAPLSPITARLVAYRKPAGAVEALLAFYPFAEDDSIAAEVQLALNATAYRDGNLDPALLKALGDKINLRRAAAAEALCQGELGEQRARIHALLADEKDTALRAKIALALAGARDRSAVPILIDLSATLAPELAVPVEEYLDRITGNLPINVALTDTEYRKKRRDIWAAWWKEHGDQTEMVAAGTYTARETYHGYTLVISANQNQILELDNQGKQRWIINGVFFNVTDAQVISENRLLVAESGRNRVIETDLTGSKEFWRKDLPGQWITSCQRLPNGNTFICTNTQILEVNRTGKEIFTRALPGIMGARKLRNGQIICVMNNGTCMRLDTTGKELKNWRHLGIANGQGIDILPNGHIVVPMTWNNRLYEVDENSKEVWTVNGVMQPMTAVRLPNGNTMVTLNQFPSQLIELDRGGKELSRTTLQLQPTRIRRR
jgi:HEAT repeat protein